MTYDEQYIKKIISIKKYMIISNMNVICNKSK